MKEPKNTCERGVMHGFHSHPCGKRAKVERDGHWYCGTHDPVAVAAKDKDRRAKWDADWAKRTESWKRDTAIRKLCDKVETEKLEALGEGWVKLVLDSIQQAGYFGY